METYAVDQTYQSQIAVQIDTGDSPLQVFHISNSLFPLQQIQPFLFSLSQQLGRPTFFLSMSEDQ